MEYLGCSQINASALNINGRIDTGERCLALCCEKITDIPASELCDSGYDTIENFVKMRAGVVYESKRLAMGDECARKRTKGCAVCANYQRGSWDGDRRIHYVNLSMYPAPCQCKCFYCSVHGGESGRFNKSQCGEYYEKMFDALDYGLESGVIAPTATWQVSSGEIAIHPYKERIFSLVKGRSAIFYTNCFIFDEGVANNLSENQNSAINLSIDSGTPATWHKVKGVDNFDAVTDNLVKYYAASARPGQITLKYIVFPGVNDNLEDYRSVIEIMKVLQVKQLDISRDTRFKYETDSEENERLVGAAGYLVAMLHKNGMSFGLFTYKPNERERVVAFANELLKSGEV